MYFSACWNFYLYNVSVTVLFHLQINQAVGASAVRRRRACWNGLRYGAVEDWAKYLSKRIHNEITAAFRFTWQREKTKQSLWKYVLLFCKPHECKLFLQNISVGINFNNCWFRHIWLKITLFVLTLYILLVGVWSKYFTKSNLVVRTEIEIKKKLQQQKNWKLSWTFSVRIKSFCMSKNNNFQLDNKIFW